MVEICIKQLLLISKSFCLTTIFLLNQCFLSLKKLNTCLCLSWTFCDTGLQIFIISSQRSFSISPNLFFSSNSVIKFLPSAVTYYLQIPEMLLRVTTVKIRIQHNFNTDKNSTFSLTYAWKYCNKNFVSLLKWEQKKKLIPQPPKYLHLFSYFLSFRLVCL